MGDEILKRYEERMREMETERRKRELEAEREEAERAEKQRRDLEELIARQERALRDAAETTGESAADADESARRLETLQKGMRDRETELNRIRAMLALLSADSSEAQTREPIDAAQNISSPASEPETKDGADEPSGGGVQYGERLTFSESYVLLSPEQKKYCDGLRAYAAQKSGAKEFPAKYHLCVGSGQKVIVKFVIKNGVTLARFRLEDERLRRLRRSATSDDVSVKIKESEVPVSDDTAFAVAKQMIDLRITQISEDLSLHKLRIAQRRKNK